MSTERRWDDRLAASIAAENLFLDVSAERRRANSTRSTPSTARPADRDGFDSIENALRGQWTMKCERGRLQVSLTLAPTIPPKVQFLRVRPAPAAAAARCLRAIEHQPRFGPPRVYRSARAVVCSIRMSASTAVATFLHDSSLRRDEGDRSQSAHDAPRRAAILVAY